MSARTEGRSLLIISQILYRIVKRCKDGMPKIYKQGMDDA